MRLSLLGSTSVTKESSYESTFEDFFIFTSYQVDIMNENVYNI